MKRLLIGACLAALPIVAQGQAAADAGQPASSPMTLRLGGFIVNGQRNYAFNNSVQSGTGSLKGVDFLWRGGGAGIAFRSLTGSFTTQPSGTPQPDVTSADASLLLGPPAFTVFLGGAKRALTDTKLNVTLKTYTFARVGAQMTFMIGGSGLSAQVGGWGYVPTDSTMKLGGEGEGSIIYATPSLPFYLQFGYRTEVFKSKTSTTEVPEEVRGLRIGGGLQFGGK